jgi:hypothetical protein
MAPDRAPVFRLLTTILRKHARGLSVTANSAGRYCLEGNIGPATLRAWGGTVKRATIPVAWAEIGKSYVSYHLMGVSGTAAPASGMSKELRARMQGKTCFNFKTADDALFEELDRLTAQSLASFRKAGFISG